MKYRIITYGYGGEYTLGTATKEEYERYLNYNSFSDIWDQDEFEDDVYNYDDIIHSWGATADCNIDVMDDNDEYVVERYQAKNYVFSNPYLSGTKLQENAKNGVAGYIGGISIEKGGFQEYELNLTEDFNPDNLRILSISMDETLCDDEIVTYMLYMTDDQIKQVLTEEKIDFEEEYFEDYFTEYIYECEGVLPEVLTKYEIEDNGMGGDTVGKSLEAIVYDEEYCHEKTF